LFTEICQKRNCKQKVNICANLKCWFIYALLYRVKVYKFIYQVTSRSIDAPPRALSPFRGGGIAYLSDPDRYAGLSFYTPVRATQARQVEG